MAKRRTSRRRAAGTRKPIRLHDAIIAEHTRLIGWPNVVRVAVGWKERRGRVTLRPSVKVYVREKTDDVPAEHVLPKTTTILVPAGKGTYRSIRVPIDVIWHAEPRFCAAAGDFLNPLMSGALLAVAGSEAGTYACSVVDGRGQRFGLTAGHVVQSVPGDIGAGIVVVQPPVAPAGLPAGESIIVGQSAGGFFGSTPNGFTDFALIRFRAGRTSRVDAVDGATTDGSVLSWETVASSHIAATKFGAVTARTEGVLAGPVHAITIDGVLVTNVYEFVGVSGRPFGQKGDSGALVVSTSPDSAGGIVGLLFATTPARPDAPGGRGYVFPFERIPDVRLA